jgi:hypothetical protein
MKYKYIIRCGGAALFFVFSVCILYDNVQSENKVVNGLNSGEINNSKPSVSSNRNFTKLHNSSRDKVKSSVYLLLEEWLNVNRASTQDIADLATKTVEELSYTDDLVKLISLLRQNKMYLYEVAISNHRNKLFHEYNSKVAENIIAMSGEDGAEEYDSLWFKSHGCYALALKCNEEQFEDFISKLEGVPKRMAVKGYATKLAVSDPIKAWDLVVNNLPEDGKFNVTNEGTRLDIDESVLDIIISHMSISQGITLLENVPAGFDLTVKSSQNNRFFEYGFNKVFDKVAQRDLSEAINLIKLYPQMYNSNTYSRLVYAVDGDSEKLKKVLEYIPRGDAYDNALNEFKVIDPPVRESTDGTTYIPKIEDYNSYVNYLNQVESCVFEARSELIKNRMLAHIDSLRKKAAELRASIIN